MTRLTREFATMQKENVPAVSADVTFLSSRFPNYRIGADNQVLEVKDERKMFSMKEIVARETAMLLEQQKRLSVRDLAYKFEKGLAAAAKLSEEVYHCLYSLTLIFSVTLVFGRISCYLIVSFPPSMLFDSSIESITSANSLTNSLFNI